MCDWLYIAGYGRSGSTLLESYLAEHYDVLGVGEIYFLWDRGFLHNEYVASGIRFHESAFWKAVLGDAFGNITTERAQRFDAVFKQFLGGIVTARPWSRASDAAFDKFGEIMQPLASAILAHADGRTIIDSSKYPMFGAALARSAGVDIGLLHCFRHPAAVAHSWAKIKKRPEAGPQGKQYMARSRFFGTSALRWKAYNTQSVRLAHEYGLSRILVPYEEFCLSPDAYLRLISKRFGLRERRAGEDIAWHSVSGNPARFEGGLDRIRLDNAWKKDMAKTARILVQSACARQFARLNAQAAAQFDMRAVPASSS